MPSPSFTRSAAARWAVVAFFALASTWNYLDRLVLSAAAPKVRSEFLISNADYGWLVAAFSFAYALASPAMGWMLDRLGLETGIVIAVGLWSGAAALCGWSNGFGGLIVARVLLGAFESAGIPANGKVNAIYLEPRHRAMGLAVSQIGLSIGGIAAPLLVAAYDDWRQPFFICAALGLGWIPLWMLLRRTVPPLQTIPPRRRAPMWPILKDRRLHLLIGANILWMVIYSLWSNWTTVYLVQTFGLTIPQTARFAWFPPVASTLGAFAGGWLSMRAMRAGTSTVDSRVLAALISAFGCLLTAVTPFTGTPLLATLAISASYFWVTAGSVNIYTIPVDIWGGESAGVAISALVFAYGLMQTIVSPLVGSLVDAFGFRPVCLLVIVTPFAAWWLLRGTRELKPALSPATLVK